jgi:hypothetical protein
VYATFALHQRGTLMATANRGHLYRLWVPKTRPGMLSRRFARRDRIRRGAAPPAPSSREPRRTSSSRILRKGSIRVHPSDGVKGAERVNDGAIRVDCAVPEIQRTMTAARAKPQVTARRVFGTHRRDARSAQSKGGPQANQSAPSMSASGSIDGTDSIDLPG